MATVNSLGNAIQIHTTGEINYPLQSAFLGILTSDVLNATGNGAVYTLGTTALTEIFDQNSDFNTNGTFTAPFTGCYLLSANCNVTNSQLSSTILIQIVTSNRTYVTNTGRGSLASTFGNVCTIIADMDAGDTAIVKLTVTGEVTDRDTVTGTNNSNLFCGMLLC